MRDNWTTVALGQIADVVAGSTPSTREPAYWGGGIPWVVPSEVTRQEGQRIMATDRTLTEAGLRSIRSPLLPVDAVLLTSRATVGAVALAGIPMAINQGFAALVAGPRVLPEFLMYWCQANRRTFEDLAGGSTFPEVSRPAVRSVEVTLPPLAEQRRIVDLVGGVDDAISAADGLQMAYLRAKSELVSGEWEQAGAASVPVAALADGSFRGGFKDGDWIESKDQSPRSDDGFRLIQLADLGVGQFLDRSDRWISAANFRRLRCTRVQPGDLLVYRMADPTGRTARIPALPYGMVTAVDCTIVRLDRAVADSDYWLAMLNSREWLAAVDRLSTGSTRRRITRRNLEAIPVPSVPLNRQIVVGGLLAALAHGAASARHVAQALSRLRSAVLMDLLSGEHEIPESYDRFLVAVA